MAHGGKRKGAGRKPKDEENKAKELTVKALIDEFGSEEEAFKFAAQQIAGNEKQSFNYFKLLIEYAYGKPKENIDLSNSDNSFSFKELLKFGNTQ